MAGPPRSDPEGKTRPDAIGREIPRIAVSHDDHRAREGAREHLSPASVIPAFARVKNFRSPLRLVVAARPRTAGLPITRSGR
ncbi:MAG: hypothetical protein D6741_21300 [Planctomycetota bacterium]|nr:MAG: hypothetical protein D6741_21300 [Planctomycetota bacterium]